MTCSFCQSTGRLLNAPHWTGTEYVRIDVCTDHRDDIARRPRNPRKPKPQPQLAGDWAMFGMFATGKSAEELRTL